jgi:replicative DNA helicase
MKKYPGLYINTEMSGKQMDLRWVSMLSQIPYYRIATGGMGDQEYDKAQKCALMIDSGAFYSVNVPDLNMNKLMSICRRFVAQKKCKIVVVDYIGRMDTMDPKLQEWQVLKIAAKRLKTIAQELKIGIIMLAQMTDADKLEGSRGMENECDLFAHLRVAEEKEKTDMVNYVLDVRKNRSGPTSKVPLLYTGDTLTFRSVKI